MENVTRDGYIALYGGNITEQEFNRLSFDAFRVMDDMTTGVDGFRKLRYAFPVDKYDAECVSRCAYDLIHTMREIESIEMSSGYVAREDGTIIGKRVASVSSGSESVSYASGAAVTVIEAATADTDKRKALFYETARKYLAGVKDAHGVNLLYMGVYPRV